MTRAYIKQAVAYLFIWEDTNKDPPDVFEHGTTMSIVRGFIDATDNDPPTEQWMVYFPDNTRALPGYAAMIYDGNFVPIIRGFIEYETLGIRFIRPFAYDWHSMKGSIFTIYSSEMSEPKDNATKVKRGYWRENASFGNEDREKEASQNLN